jgi:CheY-like chemotaxis protein
LGHLKADADLRRIPVVILTTSKAEEDVLRSYDLGANSFVSKPVTFDGLVDVVRTLDTYWFQLVALPR